MRDAKTLKLSLNLVAILEQRGVKLTKKGKSLLGHCPFHEDSTASLSVNIEAGLWHCFGCGAGGDVFTFVMLQDQVGLPEAIHTLCPEDVPAQGLGPEELEDLNRSRPESQAPVVEDRLAQSVLDRVMATWQEALAKCVKAQEYIKARALWAPEILRALGVGFSSGRLPQSLPKDGKVARGLRKMGILNERGNEFLFNRVVVPILDESGVLVNVYGRSIDPDAKVNHLYLPGPRRGVFNPMGIREAKSVILTESILDSISLIILGFPNTTASWGVNGFTADHRSALVRTLRVFCAYDSDSAGDRAAERLAHDLAGHGIEVLRVKMPTKDPNDFVKAGGTRDQWQALLDQARPMVVAVTARTASVPRAPQAAQTTPTVSAQILSLSPSPAQFVRGDRTYTLEEPPVRGRGSLSAVLRVTRSGKSCVDSFNLYSDRARSRWVGRLGTLFRGQVGREALEEDLFSLIEELDVRRAADLLAATDADASTALKVPEMTPEERERGLEFLRDPRLLEILVEDLDRLGVVGERANKMLVYLVATSRRLERPLSMSVISRASAGKSWLVNWIMDLMPPEELLRYTRLSPRALFYDTPGRYKHKILFIEEAIGAKDADLGVRSMQSERRLANLATMTDPKTGQLRTQETVVEGPLTYITSSVEPLDHETATRGFEVTIDESPEQTARIIDSLREQVTLDGFKKTLTEKSILARHRVAQRLLENVAVVNPYAAQLTFPVQTLRLRREAGKYFGLMAASAYLHQYQRPRGELVHEGQVIRYVEVAPEDVEIANRLIAGCLVRVLTDLTGPQQTLLVAIRAYVAAQAAARGCAMEDVSFSRMEMKKVVAWSDHPLRQALAKLVDHEVIEVTQGSFGKRFQYVLSADHVLVTSGDLSEDDRIAALGLTAASKLKKKATP